MTDATRLGVGVLGAGRVGPILAAALAGAGHAIVGITSGSDNERVATILPDVPVLDAVEVVRRSELVIVAVPSEQLADLITGLAQVSAWQFGQLVMHTDPAHGIAVLEPARVMGAIPFALHPAVAFTGTSIDLRHLPGSYCAVTAPAPVIPIAQALAVEMGCEPTVIAEQDRASYAEAIGIAMDFSSEIVRQSAQLLSDIGVELPGRYLASLTHATLERALTQAGRGGGTLDE